MNLKRIMILISGLSLFLLVACGGDTAAPIDVEGTVAAAVAATNEAANSVNDLLEATVEAVAVDTEPVEIEPTATAEPTLTPIPTNTSEPTEVPTATPSPTPEGPLVVTLLEDGTTLYDFVDEGFSIVARGDWVATPIDETLLEATLDSLGTQSEEINELFSSDLFRNLATAGIKFYAVNTTAASVGSPNPVSMNVLRQVADGDLDTSGYADLLATQLPEFLTLAEGSEVERSSAMLGEDTAVKLVYVSQFVNPLGVELVLHTTQYIVVKNGSSYIASITVPAELVESLLADAEAMAESIVIK